MTYGYEVRGRDDRKIETARQMAKLGVATALPGALLVSDLPFLWHIPEWLPWFSYKPLARFGRDLGLEVLNAPIQFVRDSMREEKLSGDERERAEETVVHVLGTIYAAGADTTVSAMMTFFLAMVLHPDIARKAQQELDVVTGQDRLPTFEDRPRLPFVDAVCTEVLRWQAVTPLGVPHAATEDDVYNDFLIPKGSIVVPNSWAILHDAATYPELEAFKPERFVDPEGTLRDDPTLISAFGYGKRICPGRHFAESTLFIVIAPMLSVFDIERGPDSKPFNFSYTGAIVSHPNPFACSIVPRDERAKELIIVDTMAR
ncbi:cytochrome P450 [Russula compacta]|nr:cytochrome P450 [Russula compacta]